MYQLQPIKHMNQIILTTQQIAEYYGVDALTIRQNFNNNKLRYEVGKHYHHLKGNELQVFKNSVENFYVVDKRTPSLYLWTERGAFLHAKSLGTDKAWEVYEHLVETYFRAKKQPQSELSKIEKPQPPAFDLKMFRELRLLANNKNIPAAAKDSLINLMYKEITGQEPPTPESNLEAGRNASSQREFFTFLGQTVLNEYDGDENAARKVLPFINKLLNVN